MASAYPDVDDSLSFLQHQQQMFSSNFKELIPMNQQHSSTEENVDRSSFVCYHRDGRPRPVVPSTSTSSFCRDDLHNPAIPGSDEAGENINSHDNRLSTVVVSSNPGNVSASETPRRSRKVNLDELEKVDPKRAKRINSNRQSAASSEERKKKYVSDLEQKLQTLETEQQILLVRLSPLQREMQLLQQQAAMLPIEQQQEILDQLNSLRSRQ